MDQDSDFVPIRTKEPQSETLVRMYRYSTVQVRLKCYLKSIVDQFRWSTKLEPERHALLSISSQKGQLWAALAPLHTGKIVFCLLYLYCKRYNVSVPVGYHYNQMLRVAIFCFDLGLLSGPFFYSSQNCSRFREAFAFRRALLRLGPQVGQTII